MRRQVRDLVTAIACRKSRRKRAILRLSRNGGRRSPHSMPRTWEPFADIAASIRVVRGMRVLLDDDLALVNGVTTKRLREQTRRNTDRFPSDFLIQLSRQELASLKMQNESSSWGGRRSAQLAFTEHGAIMAATVLSSPRAVQMSVYVVRAFARLRQVAATHSKLAQEFEALKQAVSTLDADTRRQFDQVYEAILGLMATSPRRQ